MLNEEKIKLMTRLAAYEQKNGKRDIRLSKYYRSDYVRFQMLNTILCGTIAFVILVVMYILYHTEYLIDNALVLDYQGLITYILTIYVLLLVVYLLFTVLVSTVRFHLSRKRLGEYYRGLKALEEHIGLTLLLLFLAQVLDVLEVGNLLDAEGYIVREATLVVGNGLLGQLADSLASEDDVELHDLRR